MTDTKRKILIVEDEILMSKNLAERFTNEGYETMVAANGEDGLKMAIDNKPDIILLDIILPKMDGLAMMKELRATNLYGKEVPVILLTNLNVDDSMLDNINRDKPAYYLVKIDWTMDQIVQLVNERIARVAIDAVAKEQTEI